MSSEQPQEYAGITWKELDESECPEAKWVVEGFLPEGLVILAGGPKLGKSWLVLDLAITVSVGGLFLGAYHTRKSKVVYMALEDPRRRLKDRSRKIKGELEPNNDLVFYEEFPKFDDAGLSRFVRMLDTHDPDLVVIDTHVQVKPPRRGGSDRYEIDSEALADLRRIAHDRGIAILLVHHAKKNRGQTDDPFDDILGSTAIFGSVDLAMMLQRAREGTGATMKITSRDIHEHTIRLVFDPETCRWAKTDGETKELNPTNRRILECFSNDSTQLNPKLVTEITKLGYEAVKKAMSRMAKEGLLESDNGMYRRIIPLSPSPGIPVQTRLWEETPPLSLPVPGFPEDMGDYLAECYARDRETETPCFDVTFPDVLYEAFSDDK